MKRNKLKALTLALASVAMSTALIGVVTANVAMADTTDNKVYALTDVFSSKSAKIDKNADNVTAFTLSNDGSVYLKRDLAFKWYTAKDAAAYLSVGFKLADSKFETVSLSVDSPSAWASEDDKATNVVKFEKTATGFAVSVNGGAKTEYNGEYVGKEMTLTLNEDACADGEFNVRIALNGQTLEAGKFTNVGSYLAEYSASKTLPLQFSATVKDDTATEEVETTTVLLTNINGQKFDNITENKEVVDTAAPVLVVNEEVSGFLLGTKFELDYDYVDVLSKDVTITREYYQYNPNHTEKKYNTLSTSVYFYETSYVKDGVPTTVYEQNVHNGENTEFLAIRFTLDDGKYSADEGEYKKPVYELAWYANADALRTIDGDTTQYIALDKNTDGPEYKLFTKDETDKENKKVTNYDDIVGAYQTKITTAAADVYAGSNSYLQLTSLDSMLGDNNGYRGLKFTVSYKSPSSTNASTLSNRAYNALEIPVSSEGTYEFKVFAVDKAGNKMKAYLDGELVDVDTSNVWDIEEIPSFTFEVKNRALKVEDPTSKNGRKATEVLDKTYTLDSVKVIGATNLQQEYSLYKLNRNALMDAGISVSDLHAVTYSELASKAADRWSEVKDGDYFAFYIKIYAELLSDGNSELVGTIVNAFEKVGVKGDNIHNADDRYEKYEWNPDTQSFKTVEKGEYIMFVDCWEAEIPTQRAAAYKVIVVENEVDEIEGENNWLENNVASVVLFSVAGLMLIIIIVLLLIKPSDETLEDVEDKAAKKEKKKKKVKKSKKD